MGLILAASILTGLPLDPISVGNVLAGSIADDGRPFRYGSITLVGNTNTRNDVIEEVLHEYDIWPAWPLSRWNMFRAEGRLAGLGLFKVNYFLSIWPRVTAEPDDQDCEFRTVFVRVVEKE